MRLEIWALAAAASLWTTPASAGFIKDIVCGFISCGGHSGGPFNAPEIDAGAGVAAVALLASIVAVIHRRNGS